jgi:hypothetical protein
MKVESIVRAEALFLAEAVPFSPLSTIEDGEQTAAAFQELRQQREHFSLAAPSRVLRGARLQRAPRHDVKHILFVLASAVQ